MEWEQKIGEKSEWYTRFTKFLLKGPSRSVLSVYNDEREALHKDWHPYENKKSVPLAWHNQVKDFSWRQRASAFDSHMAAKEQADWIKRQDEIREKQYKLGMELMDRAQDLAELPIIQTVEEADAESGGSKTIIMPVEGVTPNTAVQFGSEGSKLARNAAGMDSDAKNINLNIGRNGLALPGDNGDPPQSNMQWLRQYKKPKVIPLEQTEPTNGKENGNGQTTETPDE